jgi:hypothetical protein
LREARKQQYLQEKRKYEATLTHITGIFSLHYIFKMSNWPVVVSTFSWK